MSPLLDLQRSRGESQRHWREVLRGAGPLIAARSTSRRWAADRPHLPAAEVQAAFEGHLAWSWGPFVRYNMPMPRKYVVLLIITLGVIALDQWTKYLVVRDFTILFDGLPTLGLRLRAMYSGAPPEGLDGMHYHPKRSLTVS